MAAAPATGPPPEAAGTEPTPPPACRFFLEGRCRFGARCRQPHPGAPPPPPERSSLGPEAGAALSEAKKPPLRTAADVIRRIRWDPRLDPADFTVGYADRFQGVCEEPFGAFCWDEPLAALGPGVLAVPQHRVRFFRHRGRLVWDRASRTDLIFGSGAAAGRGPTILDALDNSTGPENAPGPSDVNEDEHGPEDAPEAREIHDGTEDAHRARVHFECGGDTEAGAATAPADALAGRHAQASSNPGAAQGQDDRAPQTGHLSLPKACAHQDNGGSRKPQQTVGPALPVTLPLDSEREGGWGTRAWPQDGESPLGPRQPRPTHFVAFMVTEPTLQAEVAATQKRLAEMTPDCSPFLVPAQALHLTVALLRLTGPGREASAAGALRLALSKPGLPVPRRLSFRDLVLLGPRVLCAHPTPSLVGTAEALSLRLEAAGLRVLRPAGGLNPHLTLAKVPRGVPCCLPKPELSPGPELGSQTLTALWLCRMGRAGDTYQALAEIPLG